MKQAVVNRDVPEGVFSLPFSNDIPPQSRRRPDPLGYHCCVYNWDLRPLDLSSD